MHSDDSDIFQCSNLSAGGSLTNSSPHGMVIEANAGGMTAGGTSRCIRIYEQIMVLVKF